MFKGKLKLVYKEEKTAKTGTKLYELTFLDETYNKLALLCNEKTYPQAILDKDYMVDVSIRQVGWKNNVFVQTIKPV